MTQEEKQLLLIDLCARLPYGVKMSNINATHNGLDLPPITIDINDYENSNPLILINSGFIPYLRPMSNMTEKELHEYNMHLFGITTGVDAMNFMIWIYQHHLDILHFIEKGLALEAPEDMYKTE